MYQEPPRRTDEKASQTPLRVLRGVGAIPGWLTPSRGRFVERQLTLRVPGGRLVLLWEHAVGEPQAVGARSLALASSGRVRLAPARRFPLFPLTWTSQSPQLCCPRRLGFHSRSFLISISPCEFTKFNFISGKLFQKWKKFKIESYNYPIAHHLEITFAIFLINVIPEAPQTYMQKNGILEIMI